MNSLVAQLTGRRLPEDASVPVPAIKQSVPPRRRSRGDIHRRTASAMLGLGEADEKENEEAIIPTDAEPMDDVTGYSGVKIDKAKIDQDKQAGEPDHPVTPDQDADMLMTPRDALVAPDVTPQAFEPIDPSEVPAPKNAPATPIEPQPPQPAPQPPPVAGRDGASAMDVLLGRSSPHGRSQIPPEDKMNAPVTVEGVQSTINASLGLGLAGDALLRQNEPMPAPTPSQPSKIMEAFAKYGPKSNRSY